MSTQRIETFGSLQGQITLNVLWLTGYDGTPIWCERCHDDPAWIVVVGAQQELL